MSTRPSPVPTATYRLQLHKDFNFKNLTEIVAYLAALGVSHLYVSPIFSASPGSSHGYDVNDPAEINPELGGIDGLKKLHETLTQHHLGLIQDCVPNHMGISGPNNWRWLDVLANGSESQFADYFDIQWNSPEPSLSRKVLVPILHDFYGQVLEAGDIRLLYENKAFWIDYRGQKLPVCSVSYSRILERLSWQYEPGSSACSLLEDLSRNFKAVSKRRANRKDEETDLRDRFSELIETERLRAGLERAFRNINGTKGQPASFDALHEILEEQHYRLAYWKVGAHEINYRRFFAIDSLVGVRIEISDVFEELHELTQHLLAEGVISGLRIDHIDGLWNPKEYLDRIRNRAAVEGCAPYIVVEKILNGDEELPKDWPVHGTTGYEFCGDLLNLLIDAQAEPDFSRIYNRFSESSVDSDNLLYELKRFIIEELFPNALDSLAASLSEQVKSDRGWRDFTVNELRDALKNILASLPVYRTYLRPGHPLSAIDAEFVNQAVDAAETRNRTQDLNPYEFIRRLWLGTYPGEAGSSEEREWADQWLCKLQQITGAITAKSVEDTYFYRYVRLLAANEVGNDPRIFGRDVQAFHNSNIRRQKTFPLNMLTTSTHDTKMSEDVRARLMALSELPEEWGFMIDLWSTSNQGFKTAVNGRMAPDRNEEYLLYQAILGAWPLDQAIPTLDFIERIKNYFQKAIAEAKDNTNWNYPNVPWSEACSRFIDTILTPGNTSSANSFLSSFVPFCEKIAYMGLLNSLAQVILKCTCPGIPDVYQGNELWDFSLVDPDNRRPVDYDLRAKTLRALEGANISELFAHWKDGRIKMFITQRLLKLRKEHPLLFSDGIYLPISTSGSYSGNLVGFLRANEGQRLLVLVSRHASRVGIPLLAESWKETKVQIPEGTHSVWRNIFSGEDIAQTGDSLEMSHLFRELPYCVALEVKKS